MRQETLPTPELAGQKSVRPDFSIYRPDGRVAAYADAKTGASIPFDEQAYGFVLWAKTTTSRTLIYYTPLGNTPISPKLIRFAQLNGVKVTQIKAP
jgi:filamentous hemagglutinin